MGWHSVMKGLSNHWVWEFKHQTILHLAHCWLCNIHEKSDMTLFNLEKKNLFSLWITLCLCFQWWCPLVPRSTQRILACTPQPCQVPGGTALRDKHAGNQPQLKPPLHAEAAAEQTEPGAGEGGAGGVSQAEDGGAGRTSGRGGYASGRQQYYTPWYYTSGWRWSYEG